jgi:type IVB pilus formation R64 PilN family outer membrane protein
MRTTSFKWAFITLALVATLSLVGCANPATRTAKISNEGASKAEATLDQAKQNMTGDDRPVVQEHQGQYVDITPSTIGVDFQDNEAPACNVRFPASALTIDQFRGLMATGKCHVVVRFTPDAMRHITGTEEVGKGADSSGNTRLPPDPAGGRIVGAVSFQPTISISYDYDGDVQPLLKNIADQLGLWVRRDGSDAEFYYTETRTFHVDLMNLSSDQTLKVASGITAGAAGVSSSSSGGNGQATTQTSQSAQTLTFTAGGNVADDLKNQLKAMLGDGNFAYGASDGVLVATGTPDKLAMVQHLVDETNAKVTKEVRFLTTLVLFTNTTGDTMSEALTLAFNNHGRGATIGSNTPISTTGGTTVGFVVNNNATGKLSQFAGSQLTVNALRQVGTVDVLQEHLNTTLNLQPTAYQDGTDTTYLAESGNTLTAGGSATGFSQTLLIPGTVTTGLNLTLKPFVYGDGKTVAVQFGCDLSALDQLTNLTSNGQTIQGPQVSKNVIDQIQKLRSGQTLVITGIRNHTNKTTKAGTLSPSFWGLGGGIDNQESKQVGMILITAVVD